MKGFFILFILLGLVFNSFAQSDYVVDNKGDTTWGRLKKSLVGKIRLETKEGKVFMDPQLHSLYYHAASNLTFCSLKLPGATVPLFFTRLVSGAINMYSYTSVYYNGKTSYSSTSWYAEKKGIPLNEIKGGAHFQGGRKHRKDFFRSLIADNPVVAKRFDEENKFTVDFLKELIEEYNKSAK